MKKSLLYLLSGNEVFLFQGGREDGTTGNRTAQTNGGHGTPATCNIVSRTISNEQSPELSMVLEKAQVLLSKADYAALSVLLSEYDAREITIDIFVNDLLSLISDQEKVPNSIKLHILLKSTKQELKTQSAIWI